MAADKNDEKLHFWMEVVELGLLSPQNCYITGALSAIALTSKPMLLRRQPTVK